VVNSAGISINAIRSKSNFATKIPKLRNVHEAVSYGFETSIEVGEEFLNFLKILRSIKWFVTFNGNYYDDYILNILLDITIGEHPIAYGRYKIQEQLINEIYNLSVNIIERKIRPNAPKVRSIDLKHVA